MHQNYIKIGKALKTHGFKGNLKIEVEDIYIKDFDKCTYVFINNIPYFIEEKNIESEYIYIKFEDIESKEEAQLLCSQDIFLEKKQLITFIQSLDEMVPNQFPPMNLPKSKKLKEAPNIPYFS